MSPPIFFLGISSITAIWATSTVGLPPYCWSYFVVPCVSVFCLCDHDRLRQGAVSEFREFPRGAIIFVAILVSLYMGHLREGKLVIPLCSIVCLIKAFSHEKMMYMGDVCGMIAKFAFWTVGAAVIPSRAKRMRWKGDWAYCSPYSRRAIRKDIDYYFILKPETDAAHEANILQRFDLEFTIEDCKIVCKYSPAAGDGIHPENRSHAAAGPVPEEGEVPSTPDVLDKDKGYSASSSSRPGAAVVTAADGGNSSSGAGDSQEDRSRLMQCPLNKLEVTLSLEQGDNHEELESFTFFQREGDRIMEVKRAMELLASDHNLIFSNFHTNVGSSSSPTAHARCNEFEEIFELILDRGYKLHKVALDRRYSCVITGTATAHICQIVVTVSILFYQLSPSAPKKSVISLLVLFICVELFIQFVDNLYLKRFPKLCFYWLIRSIIPSRHINKIYQYLQVWLPCLTFCNLSYGYPYNLSKCTVICCFQPLTTLRVNDVEEPKELPLEEPPQGNDPQTFELGALRLRLIIMGRTVGEQSVHVLMKWVINDGVYYNAIFRVRQRQRLCDLISLLKWLNANKFQGVCKEWTEGHLIHAYTYKELVEKLFDEADTGKLCLLSWTKPIDMRVEGVC